jgi:hypothetical protein
MKCLKLNYHVISSRFNFFVLALVALFPQYAYPQDNDQRTEEDQEHIELLESLGIQR